MNAIDTLDGPRTLARFELTPDTLGYIERFASIMATAGETIPGQYRNNPGNCAAVTIQALIWGMNPFALAAKTHFVGGSIGYEAQAIIAAVNNSGRLSVRLDWEWFGAWESIIGKFEERESRKKMNEHGEPLKYRVPAWRVEDEDGLGVRCFATLKGEDKPRELVIYMKQARVRNSTLWADDPKQQIAYLSAKRWSRLFTPEVVLGIRTPDELAA
ncbi:RecT family recombinase [Caballeronia zhejiangensis]|uniref:Enterohemolysin n=2 Tax=Burkholderiaceae TaxID=119060 RepID=A0A656QMX5_9BURK|nr:RecT family recombinase [Caballeronia zhejiangensis]KDR31537.1 enterohemolysin [Caballeronia zhejiangensis]